MKPAISRRAVLRGMGTCLALPWLEAMVGRGFAASTSAATDDRILRHVFLYVPNGAHMPGWTPTQTGVDFELPPTFKAIAEFRHQMTFLSGLTLNGARALGDGGGDHARSVASFLTGAHPKKTDGADIKNGQSVDQRLAELSGQKTRLPSLELGMEPSAPAGRCDSGYSCVYTSNMSWRNETSPVAKEVNPTAVFDRLFGNDQPHESAASKARREKYRKSVLDFVAEDAKRLHRELGRSDQRKLDEYLYSIRQVEQQIAGADRLEGHEVGVPDYPRPAGVPAEYAEHMRLMFDLLTLAIQTDSTRVISFMYSNAGSNRGYREIDVPEGHHDLSHHGNDESKQEKIARINEYHVSLLHHLLTRLSSIQEGSHSLLDNCLVQYGSGIGDGNRHNHDNLPIVLFGQGAGRLQPGRHIELPSETPLTNLYLTMIRQAGGHDRQFGDSTDALELPAS